MRFRDATCSEAPASEHTASEAPASSEHRGEAGASCTLRSRAGVMERETGAGAPERSKNAELQTA